MPKPELVMRSHRDLVIIVIIAILALLQRFITMGHIDSGISSDEFYHAVNAVGIAKIFSGASVLQMRDIYVMHPLVSYPVGLLSLFVPTDALLLGRYIQITLNALTIPLTYFLARDIGFGRWSSSGAALILSILGGYWENASHFWPDSQFTFLILANCLLFTRILRNKGTGYVRLLTSALVLMMATLTREHAPVILLLPFGYLFVTKIFSGELVFSKAIGIAISHIGVLIIAYLLMSTGLFFPRSDNVAVALGIAPTEGPDIVMQRTTLLQETPSFFLSSITHMQFNFERLNYGLGEGVGYIFLIFAAVGLLSGLAIVFVRPSKEIQRLSVSCRLWIYALGTLVLTLCFCLLMSVVLSNLPIPFAGLLTVAGIYILQYLLRERFWQSGRQSLVIQHTFGNQASGIELTFYGLVVVCVSIVNMSFDPQISSGARFFFPILPLIAVFGAHGMVALADSGVLALFGLLYSLSILTDSRDMQVALPMHRIMLGLVAFSHCTYILISKNIATCRWKLYVLPTVMLLLILTTPFSKLVSYSQRSSRYMGYPDDPHYSEIHDGIRWRILNEIRPWLQKHVEAEDRVLSHHAHYIAWSAGTGLRGLYNSIYLPKDPREASTFLSEKYLTQLNVDYIVQINPYLHKYADRAQYEAWVNIYDTLATRGDLQQIYLQESPLGDLESYVFRRADN